MPLYRKIYFFGIHYNRQFRRKLSTLARDVDRNPGLRFTTAFSCTLGGGAAGVLVPWGEIHRDLTCILHSLANLRRTTISFQGSFTDIRILHSLPSSAPLTHLNLAECSLSREHLLRVLQCWPALQWLDMHMPRQTEMAHDLEFPADVLPHLAFLSIGYSDVGVLKNPLRWLVAFTLHTRKMVLDDAGTIRCLMAPYASITACHLPAIDAAKVVPIVTCFPCLEYLGKAYHRNCAPPQGLGNIDYTALSATKLKYLRILDDIERLIVVDISLFPYETLRVCRGDERAVQYPYEQWSRWPEHASNPNLPPGPKALPFHLS